MTELLISHRPTLSIPSACPVSMRQAFLHEQMHSLTSSSSCRWDCRHFRWPSSQVQAFTLDLLTMPISLPASLTQQADPSRSIIVLLLGLLLAVHLLGSLDLLAEHHLHTSVQFSMRVLRLLCSLISQVRYETGTRTQTFSLILASRSSWLQSFLNLANLASFFS